MNREVDMEAVMSTTPHWDRVSKFMVKAKQPTPDRPTLPPEDVRRLRASLILEEALETIRGLGFTPYALGIGLKVGDVHFGDSIRGPNLEAIADGCADLSVVNVGTLIACGIRDECLLEEVDMNNLAKFGPGHSWREDGKLIKPPDHKPPDIKSVLRDQGWNE